MLNWPIIIVCAVGISLLLTAVFIPQILHVSFKKRLFDRPNSRKVHQGVVPRLGGFAFLPVILITLGITLVMPAAYTRWDAIIGNPTFVGSLPDIIVLLASMTVMFLTGLYDDLSGLKYGMKFLAQLLCAVLLVEAGLYITDFNDLLGVGHTGMAIGKIITGFFIVYIINGINLIDGIDGLASGICIVSLVFYGIVMYLEGLFMFSLLAWIGVGTMTVFWAFNVFGSRARRTKIFMGDIGSLSIGVFLAFIVIVIARIPQEQSAWNIRPMVLALSPLVIPLFDVIRVFFIRIIHRTSPFMPDKRHIHHIMLGAGMQMKGAMNSLVGAQIILLLFNLWVSEALGINIVLILDAAIYACGVLAFDYSRRIRNKKK